MRNIKLTLAYDGTAYFGWQRQREPDTIQGICEAALARMAGETVVLHGAGRTDAGVHALGQVASFRTCSTIPPAGLCKGLNSLLPAGIRVLGAEDVDPQFHARYSACGKKYRYVLTSGQVQMPCERCFALFVPGRLDWAAMAACLDLLAGEHDFRSFAASGAAICEEGRGSRRRIETATLRQDGIRVEIEIVGDGFLRHMVRNIVGTLLEVGKGRLSQEGFQEVIAARDRTLAGPTAPAHGLFLVEVFY